MIGMETEIAINEKGDIDDVIFFGFRRQEVVGKLGKDTVNRFTFNRGW